MRVDRLRIENFRRFKLVDLELPDGVTAVVGRNGAGKSTLLEALGWCLYGHPAARTGKELIRRTGAGVGDDVSVLLVFRFGGSTYEVTRELLGKGQSPAATVKVDGRVVVPAGAGSADVATSYIERLFHMDRAAFFTSLVARQRELAALTDAKPSDRKKILIALLRLDAIDDAIQLARDRRRTARAELAGLRAAYRDPKPIEVALVEVRARVEADRKAVQAAQERIVVLIDELEDARTRREEGRKRKVEHQLRANEAALLDAHAIAAARETTRIEAELARARVARNEAALLAPRLDEIAPTRALLDTLTALRRNHQELARVSISLANEEKLAERARLAAAEAAALAPRLEGLGGARATVDRLLSLRVRHDELARASKDLEAARSDVERARLDAESAMTTVAALTASRTMAARVAAERPRLEARAEEVRGRAETLVLAQHEARQAMQRADEHARRIRELGADSTCPTCLQPLADHHDATLKTLADESRQMRARIEALAPDLAALRAEEAAARQSVVALAVREKELAVKLQTLAAEEMRLEAAKARAADAAIRASALEARARALAAEPFEPAALAAAQALVAELEGARTRHTRLTAESENGAQARVVELRARAAELSGAPFDPAAFEAAQARLVELDRVRDRHSALAAAGAREPEWMIAFAASIETHNDLVARLAAARAACEAVGFDPAAHAALEASADALDAKLNEARVLRERLLGEQARRLDEERRLVADLAESARLAQQAAGLEARVLLLEQLAGEREQGLLPEFKDHLIGRIRPLLTEHAGRLFRDLTDGRYQDLEVSDDYGLRVQEDGTTYDIARYSGGEGDLANLCLRLAVSQVVAERAGSEGFGFLALDEVFGSQDEVRKSNILRALKGVSARFRQILLITHIGDVKESAEHVLRVEAHDDGTSTATLEG